MDSKEKAKIMIPIATGEEAAKVFLESEPLTEMQKFARKCLFWKYEDETDEKEVDETNKN